MDAYAKSSAGPSIAILREQKQPAERRAPLTPAQVAEALATHKGLRVLVQPSPDRCFTDAEYAEAGAVIQEDVAEADHLLGIKERKAETLMAGKHYLIFSHTIKRQPANQRLLATFLQRGCQLTDYECITDAMGHRLVAFGYFAGVVGALHALRMLGIRHERFTMGAPYSYPSQHEAMAALAGADLSGLRVVVTGRGRVSSGAVDVLVEAGFVALSPEAFLAGEGAGPVFTQLSSRELHQRRDGEAWAGYEHFYRDPSAYGSAFAPYLAVADGLITGAFWGEGYPQLFAVSELAAPTARMKVIADVSCDILGAVPCTTRATTIEEPYFDLDPATGAELAPFSDERAVSVMSVDNLPCEMPKDASRHFGRQLLDAYLGDLLSDGPITARATLCEAGRLTPYFSYLADYAGMAEVRS